MIQVQLLDTVSQRAITVKRLPAVIGRDPGTDVPIDDPALPPYQCMVGKDGDGAITVWNLRPEFSVSVNGQATVKSALRDGDELSIGERRFVVQVRQAAEQARSGVAGSCGERDMG